MHMDVRDRIKEHMPVVGVDGEQFATVDHLDADNTIKLTKDDEDNHHWIPLAWVTGIDDDKVVIDRTVGIAMTGWSTVAPGTQ